MSCINTRRKFVCSRPSAENVTRTVDYSIPADPSGRPPYLREHNTTTGGVDCPATPTHCGEAGFVLCDQWRPVNSHIAPDHIVNCIADRQVDFNCYELIPSVTLHNTCCPIGFKNLQSRRAWHGRFGFQSEYWQSPTATDWPSSSCYDPPGTFHIGPICTCRAENNSPDQTKYLSMTMRGTFEGKEELTETIHTSTIDRSVSVGSNTGVMTLDNCESSSDGYCAGSFGGVILLSTVMGFAQRTLADYIAHFLVFSATTQIRANVDIVRAANTWTATINDPISPFDGFISEIITCDFSGSFSRDVYDLDNGDSAWKVSFHEVGTLTNTTADFVQESNWNFVAGGAADCLRYRLTLSTTMSNPNTWATVLADAYSLQAVWDLKNDIVYPWRHDNILGAAPLITRSETPGNTAPDFLYPQIDDDCLSTETDHVGEDWVDPQAAFYNGSILGAPGEPGAMSFDWNNQIYTRCGDGLTTYVRYYGCWNGIGANGGYLAAGVMPQAATQWTWNYHAQDLRAGRWVMMPGSYNGSSAPHCFDGVWIQDWREIRIVAPRQDWSRPCGELDQYLMDENTVRCIDVDSGGGDDSSTDFVLFDDYDGRGFPAIIVGDRLTVWGTGVHAGAWTVSAVNSGTHTVTAHRTGDLPAGFAYAHDGGPMLGKRRFPDAPSTCDRAWNGGASVPASRGNWVRHTWNYNFRDFQERARLIANVCTACSAGGPAIRSHQAGHGMPQEVSAYAAVQMNTPLGDCVRTLFPEDFPASIQGDAYYGILWQSAVQQWMPDLYWQPEHKTCEQSAEEFGPINWSEDVYGQCIEDDITNFYYPGRPWVEAELAVPAGAPALPSGIYVGFLTLSDLDTGSAVHGNVAPPPGAPGFADPAGVEGSNDDPYGLTPAAAGWTPWQMRINECDCIAAAAHFASDYIAQGVHCG